LLDSLLIISVPKTKVGRRRKESNCDNCPYTLNSKGKTRKDSSGANVQRGKSGAKESLDPLIKKKKRKWLTRMQGECQSAMILNDRGGGERKGGRPGRMAPRILEKKSKEQPTTWTGPVTHAQQQEGKRNANGEQRGQTHPCE